MPTAYVEWPSGGQYRSAARRELTHHLGWACGLARSIQAWRDTFRHLDTVALASAASGTRGAQVWQTEIDDAVPVRWIMPPMLIERLPGNDRWLGQFTPRGIPLAVACHLADSTIIFLSVTDESQL